MFRVFVILLAFIALVLLIGKRLKRVAKEMRRDALRREVYEQHGLKQIWPERERRRMPR